MSSLPPGALLLLGSLALPLVPARLRGAYAVALTLSSLAHVVLLFGVEPGVQSQLSIFDYTLSPVRVDRLSLVFGLIFHIAALLSTIYAFHVKEALQHVAGLIYAGGAIGAVFAGDLITLFAYWELTAISSVFLIWASRTERAYRAGIRYLIIQVGSGVLLLAGILFHFAQTGSLSFEHLGLGSIGTNLIFVAFGIKCAFPFLHNWLQDAYPEATVTGTVFLSAFTTKLAIYTLARGYAGTEILIWIGVTMTIFPIFFAVIENNLRRVLAYSLNNQLGFMVVGIGIGSELALNGTVAHAFAHILYKALLFMGMGAVLYRTGTIKASQLGGLYKSMPATALFTIIGAMSISAFPLFSGFTTKSMIMTGAAEAHLLWIYVGLLFASAGVMEHSGIKIPFFAFFGHDSGIRCREAPWNMLLAMGIGAFLCIALGVYPEPLYRLLPYPVEYQAYTTTHVVTQLQLLLFAALAFAVLIRTGRYPAEIPSVNLDFDWFYRVPMPRAWAVILRGGTALRQRGADLALSGVRHGIGWLERHHGEGGALSRTWPTGSTVLWVAVLLGSILLIFYW